MLSSPNCTPFFYHFRSHHAVDCMGRTDPNAWCCPPPPTCRRSGHSFLCLRLVFPVKVWIQTIPVLNTEIFSAFFFTKILGILTITIIYFKGVDAHRMRLASPPWRTRLLTWPSPSREERCTDLLLMPERWVIHNLPSSIWGSKIKYLFWHFLFELPLSYYHILQVRGQTPKVEAGEKKKKTGRAMRRSEGRTCFV